MNAPATIAVCRQKRMLAVALCHRQQLDDWNVVDMN